MPRLKSSSRHRQARSGGRLGRPARAEFRRRRSTPPARRLSGCGGIPNDAGRRRRRPAPGTRNPETLTWSVVAIGNLPTDSIGAGRLYGDQSRPGPAAARQRPPGPRGVTRGEARRPCERRPGWFARAPGGGRRSPRLSGSRASPAGRPLGWGDVRWPAGPAWLGVSKARRLGTRRGRRDRAGGTRSGRLVGPSGASRPGRGGGGRASERSRSAPRPAALAGRGRPGGRAAALPTVGRVTLACRGSLAPLTYPAGAFRSRGPR